MPHLTKYKTNNFFSKTKKMGQKRVGDILCATPETAGQRDNGTTGQRDDGTTGRRDDGTTGRRDDGTTGRRDDGTTGLRDDGTTGRRDDGTTGRRDDGTTGLRDSFSRRLVVSRRDRWVLLAKTPLRLCPTKKRPPKESLEKSISVVLLYSIRDW